MTTFSRTSSQLTWLVELPRTLPVLPRCVIELVDGVMGLIVARRKYVMPEGSTAYIGAVGGDSLADQLRAANKKEGLKEYYQVVAGHQTGACAVVITGHHRCVPFPSTKWFRT